jgi:flavin reductase (DIM6/NTAB) family NADH-FMN oxidoreductase RutF
MQDMKKLSLNKAFTVLEPGPVVLVTTANNGKQKIMTLSWTMVMDFTPRFAYLTGPRNYSYKEQKKTKEFNLSVLAESAVFSTFEQFGFHSGKDTDKFAGCGYNDRTANGIRYVSKQTNCVISAKVVNSYDYGTHTVFMADVTQSLALSDEPSATYQYYFDNIKPKPQPPKEAKKGFVCKICGYTYEGESLPEDFICPLCKHGARDFESI